MSDLYEGSVCYLDGWHWSVVDDGAGGERPDRPLYLEDDGTYRFAIDGDESWHDRKHETFTTVEPSDGSPGLRVSPDELAFIKEKLAERRGEGDQ